MGRMMLITLRFIICMMGIILGLGLGGFVFYCVICAMASFAMIFGEMAPWIFCIEVLLLGLSFGDFLPETSAHRNFWDY